VEPPSTSASAYCFLLCSYDFMGVLRISCDVVREPWSTQVTFLV
jgi:hypothetical protein